MTQVSRNPISKDTEEKMFDVFQKAISSLRDSNDINNFLQEFLTPNEKIMLAKRFFVAVLLEKSFDYETIKDILHVTPQTIARVNSQLKYAGDGYKKVVERILREEAIMNVWGKVGDVLSHIPAAKGASFKKSKDTTHSF